MGEPAFKSLGFSTYAEYLDSALWRDIRFRVFRANQHCRCGKPATEVHHSDYSLETMQGFAMENLHSICRDCHQSIEFDADGRKRTLDEANTALHRIGRRIVPPEERITLAVANHDPRERRPIRQQAKRTGIKRRRPVSEPYIPIKRIRKKLKERAAGATPYRDAAKRKLAKKRKRHPKNRKCELCGNMLKLRSKKTLCRRCETSTAAIPQNPRTSLPTRTTTQPRQPATATAGTSRFPQ